MAEISLYLANANITLTEDMGPEKSITKGKEFEFVELGDLETKEEKSARRLIHFSSGETMEEVSTEEEEDAEKNAEKKDLLSPVDMSQMTWGPYVWFQMWRAASSTVSACDYLGEKMASLFGITSSKYQYAIDEYNKIKKREGVPVDSGLSEEAEELFVEPQNEETHEPNLHQPEATAAEDITTSLPVPSPSTISVHGHTVSP
ncbi:protein FAM177A1-like isoform X1 [Brachyhypopomus gauderio]|uniref:protein FAM177A1-like isoform X1 n=1 Tax=Brachyhypopomus gauderio TaxID=698409 RepID=UPI004042B40D